LAALYPLTQSTDAMVDAAHEAVSFDGAMSFRCRSDAGKAVRAMGQTAIE
jgi:hypothetical protein